MIKTLPLYFKEGKFFIFMRIAALFLLLDCSSNISAQTTVFSDSFSVSAGAAYDNSLGAIGTSTIWNQSLSGQDFGARIDGGVLALTNDASAAANINGWNVALTNTSSFIAPYNSTLAQNPGLVTWTFNMRQQQSNPSGFANGNYGVAFILAGTSATTLSSGTGYAVVLGNSGKIDPVRLVRFNSGLSATTDIISSNTLGLTDFGNPYISVKVTYSPSNNTWELFIRNDGAAFIDPTSGSLTSQGTATNATYTSSILGIMGGLWNANTKFNQVATFDNVKVTVVVPTTTSISPSSAIAGTSGFTLTVNGTGFVSGTSVVKWNGSNRVTTFVSPTQLTAAITSTDILTSGTALVTVANGVAVSNAQTFTIDPAGVPVLTLSTSGLSNLTSTTGTASSALTYTISGANLTSDPIVTAPTNFEVSRDGVTYAASVTLPRTGNTVTGQPLTLYSRISAGAPAGIYSGTITHTAAGAITKNVSVSGIVLNTKPTIQATSVVFSTVTSTSFTASWTNGNGSNRLVLIRASSAVNGTPSNGFSYFTNTSFGNGSEVGTGNYAVYNGSGNSVTITDLQPATTYFIAVFEFNGSGGTENYLTTTPASGSRATINSPLGWQIYAPNAVNTINFDNTVDGVNNGQFQGDGLGTVTVPGELSSNAFAITGFSDGAIAFGGSSNINTDFERGTSNTSSSIGGLYAFQVSPNNYALGIQPATGDFVPGSVTLRFQNQTAAAVTSINIGYKVYVYNDQAASNSLNFSYSADNSTYTSAPGLNVTSPATADSSPGWKAYYRVITITGLNIASNAYYHFRWTGATVSGSGAFDAFGLDDIVMVANPTSNFVPFSGLAENFIIQGNTALNGTSIVSSDITFNGGKLDLNGNTLSVNGTITNTTSQGIKSNGASNLIIGGAVSPTVSIDQTTVGTTNAFNNFSINTTAANTVTLSNPIVVNGTLTTASNQTLNLGTNALTGTLATINNNGNILTQNTSATPIPSGKTWGGTGILNFNGSAQQNLPAGNYNNLTITTPGGAVASASVTVNGVLNLPASNPSATVGSLSMGTFTLTMGGNATNSGVGDVTGIIARDVIIPNVLYTFGHPHTSAIFPATGTLPTSMRLKTSIGLSPTWKPGAIKRVFDFTQTGGSATKAVLRAHYLDAELNGNLESRLVDWAYIIPSATLLEQGRSNFDSTENWVELTNVNVGLYFSSSFGVVELSLANSEANSLIWNGSVSTSWTTAANWTPNATPSDLTVVYIPNASTTPNSPTLNSSVLLGSLNIDAGGILNAPSASQFTINNGAGAWINNGIYNAGGGNSTVTFTSPDATIAGSTLFNDLTITIGAALRPITDNFLSIAGTFTNNGIFNSGLVKNTVEYTGTNQTIVNPNGALAAYYNLLINGNGAIFPNSINIIGNLSLNQSVNFTGKTIAMTGNLPQVIDGLISPTFNNLIINNTLGGVSLVNNALITGILTLSSGLLNVGNNVLTLGTNAVSGSFDNSKMIVVSTNGQVRRTYTGIGSFTFPIGEITNGADFSPITVNLTAGSFSNAYIGVTVIDAVHPNNYSTQNNISRYWNVTQVGITGAVANVTATYTPEDILGTESDIAAAELNGTFNQQSNSWVKFAPLASNTLTATGAVLTSGQTAAFTGINGATFSTIISGFGSFCQNSSVTLTATPINGDAPYTYSWSNGLGTLSTASPSTTTVGSTSYTVTVKDSNGITSTDTATVTVLASTVGGTIAANQTICSGTQPSNLTLSGNIGSVLYWQSSANSLFSAPTNIANSTTILSGVTIGSLTSTTYFRAVVRNGSCNQVNSAQVAITVSATPTTATNTSTQTLCSSGTTSLSGNAPLVGTGTWSVVTGPSTSTSQFSNVNNPTAVFTSSGGSGNYVVRWTISNAPCTASFADATITISGSGAPPTATNNSSQSICAASTAILSANTPTVGTGAWALLNGPSTAASQFSSLSNPSAIFTPSGGAGIYQIRWTITNFSCTASADATITVIASPTVATNNSTQTICDNSSALLAANMPTVGTGIWSVLSGPSISSSQFNNSSNPLSLFTPAGGAGSYVVRWIISNAPCAPSIADAVITVIGAPTAAANMSNQTICIGSTASLSGNLPTVGTGAWTVVNGPSTVLSQFSNTSSPTAVFTPASGVGDYIVRWSINNAPCASSFADATITVNGISVGGNVSGGTAVCSGSTSGILTLLGQTGTIVRWESSTDNFATITTIANTTNTYTSGPLSQTTQFRAVVQSGTCPTAYSSIATITIASTTWNGTTWTNGAPISTTTAIISGNFTSAGDFNACSLTVDTNAIVVISSGDTVTLNGALTVVSGNVTFNNNAILLQNGTTNTNSGNITIVRNSSAIKRLDYTLWSSPVAGQQLLAFSPLTLTNRFYDYAPSTNLYTNVDPAADFATASGYLIRTPNTHPLMPTIYNGYFTGIPNNGNYSRSLFVGDETHRFNLIGNPYPSPISMTQFVSENNSNISGTLYFWRKTNNALSPSYSTWKAGTFVSNGEAQVVDPQGIIRTGQGFFVEAKANTADVLFANTQRVADNADQFFRTTTVVEQNRIWLNASNNLGAFSQMEFGYVTGATNGIDDFDGKYINDGNIALYGLVGEEKLVIQGRALPFDIADVVPLGFKATTAGTFTIALDHVDGLFTANQDILLKDNTTQAVHDLKSGAYTFIAESGTFNNRFEIIFTTPLSISTVTAGINQIIAYKSSENLIIRSGSVSIASVKVFDISGRLLAQKKGINTLEESFRANWSEGLLLVEITDANGIKTIKKVIW